MTLKRGESDADNRTMRNRIVLAAVASGMALTAVIAVATSHEPPTERVIVTTGSVSDQPALAPPAEISSTTSTSRPVAADPAPKKISTTTTTSAPEPAVVAPVSSSPVVDGPTTDVAPVESTTTTTSTSTSSTTSTTMLPYQTGRPVPPATTISY